MTADARAIAEQAYKHAIRLGHPYLGGEHFLLALAAAGESTGDGRLAGIATTRRADPSATTRAGHPCPAPQHHLAAADRWTALAVPPASITSRGSNITFVLFFGYTAWMCDKCRTHPIW